MRTNWRVRGYRWWNLLWAKRPIALLLALVLTMTPLSSMAAATPASPSRNPSNVAVYRVTLTPGSEWTAPPCRFFLLGPGDGRLTVAHRHIQPGATVDQQGGGGGGCSRDPLLRNDAGDVGTALVMLFGLATPEIPVESGVTMALVAYAGLARPFDPETGIISGVRDYQPGQGESRDTARDGIAIIVVTNGMATLIPEAGVATHARRTAGDTPEISTYERGELDATDLSAGDAIVIDQGAAFGIVAGASGATVWITRNEPNSAASQEHGTTSGN